jgi:hypothetical protein
MKQVLATIAALAWLAAPGFAAGPGEIAVYRTPTCGCCSDWVKHLEANGFTVEDHVVADLREMKSEHGVTPELASCHTAFVDGYVIEGHVPAADIARLLETRPPVAGLAVPGMPIGSPGMEGPNPETYRVLAFDGQGTVETFTTHVP